MLMLVLGCAAATAQRGEETPDLAQAAQQIVAAANSLRREQGLGAVASDATLTQTAAAFAEYMARSDRYAHDADGRQPSQRAEAAGYAYCKVAENIAYQFHSEGFATTALARGFADGWARSPGHRRNLLDVQVTHIGVALARSARSGRYYAVQMFGRPQSMRLRFEVRNAAGQEVVYSLDGEPHRLPPNVTRTHQVCGAGRLALAPSSRTEDDDPGATTRQRATGLEVDARDGMRYRVERSGARPGWQFTAERAADRIAR